MEQLTINHLAPYLPYKLRFTDGENTAKMISLDIANATCIWTGGVVTIPLTSTVSKPLLRPLYQLTETIEHNGERFVPESIINDIVEDVSMYQYSSDNRFEITKQTPDYSIGIDYYDGYLIMQKLFSWHFDVFGLIKKGLAIPIPSLNS